jgi:hypothetical protein
MKFVCKSCGCCCQGFLCLPVYEWELEGIKKNAAEKGLQLDIRPDWKNTFFDEVSEKPFALFMGFIQRHALF